jgi:acetolactate synthase-1/2/3 large subunit
VGVRFSDRATGNIHEYSKNRKIIHIDIDMSEMGKNVTDHIGLCGDVKEVLTILLKSIPPFKNAQWLESIKENKKKDPPILTGTFNPRNIIELVNSKFDDNTVVTTDVGQHQIWVTQYYKFEKPRTLLTSGGLGTMGYGFGAAIGACMAKNRARTIFFTSDGSFGMNLIELATAVSQKLPIVIIILNNGVLGMVKQWQDMFYDNRYSQTVLKRQTNFPMLAQSFGADGFSADSLDELELILKSKLKDDVPCLIECKIDMDEKVLPMIPPGTSIKNIVLK